MAYAQPAPVIGLTRGGLGRAFCSHSPQRRAMRVARRQLITGAALRSHALRVHNSGQRSSSAAGAHTAEDGHLLEEEHTVVTQLRQSLTQHNLVSRGTPVITCVSGGVDSVALLLGLHAVSPDWQLRMHVLHFNHGLRAESPSEGALVKALAQDLQLQFHLREAPQGSWASSGVSAAARAWRRGEALSLAQSLASEGSPAPAVIALAHHADDQRETVLLKLLRGCHISRIAGMAPKAGPFIRPLLSCSKAQLTDYVRSRGVAWAEDASNANPDYSRRNAVRLRLVPLLQELTGSGLDARLHDAQHQSRLLRLWLDSVQPAWTPRGAHSEPEADDEGSTWMGNEGDESPVAERADARILPGELDLPSWRALPAVARLDQLHAFIASHLGSAAVAYTTLRELAARAESLDGRPRWTAHITSTWRLVRSGDRLRVQLWSGSSHADGEDGDLTDSGPVVNQTTTYLGGIRVHHPAEWKVTLHQVPASSSRAATHGPGVEWWSADAQAAGITLHALPPDAELTLRTRRDGDRFTPYWRQHGDDGQPSWKLRDLLRDAGVPVHVRDALPLVQLDGDLVAVYPAWTDARVTGGRTRADMGDAVSVHLTISP